MCDFEFTVELGRLYLLSVRPGKRTSEAAIRIAIDLFVEGQITGAEILRRITPKQIQDSLQPVIVSKENLHVLGTGVGASSGVVTGLAVFSANDAIELRSKGKTPILLTKDFSPDDIFGMDAAGGLVSFVGGKSSHAAVVARGMGSPCVAGTGWRFENRYGVITGSGVVHEEDAVTIDGTNGIVYSGAAIVQSPNPFENECLVLIGKLIDLLASESALPHGFTGSAWRIRDILFHRLHAVDQPDCRDAAEAWHVNRRESVQPRAYNPLTAPDIFALSAELLRYTIAANRHDQSLIWFGMRHCLLRLLSKYVGIGRHPHFYRPLFDPFEAILPSVGDSNWDCCVGGQVQFVGEEFFSINHYVPDYPEFSSIRIYAAVECSEPSALWRIDRTNPHGEKLLNGSHVLLALKLVVNDSCVPLSELSSFYNYFRRKEYFWKWYTANGMSRQEIIEVLKHERRSKRASSLRAKLIEAGLLTSRGAPTCIGESFLRPTTAVARAMECPKIGW